MGTVAFESTWQPMLDDNGAPVPGGKLYFFAPGLSEFKPVYSTPFLDVEIPNPVILEDDARAIVWLNNDYDMEFRDADDVLIYSRSNINPDTAGANTGLNLVTNGSFELNTNGDGKTPDGWTLTEETGSTVTLNTSDSFVGGTSWCATSAGNGGGNIISANFFEISGGEILTVSWAMKSSAADLRNLVQIIWYDASQSSISTTALYDAATGNPTDWTRQLVTVTSPSTARFAKIQFYAAHPSDATTGQTCYDGVEIFPSSIGGAFPSGTVMLFQQATAPAGWTKQTTHNNTALRLVSGTPGTGGTVDFSTAFVAARSVAVTVNAAGSHFHTAGSLTVPLRFGRFDDASGDYQPYVARVGATGTAGANVNLGLNGNTATDGNHVHTAGGSVNLAVKYVDIIAAAKD